MEAHLSCKQFEVAECMTGRLHTDMNFPKISDRWGDDICVGICCILLLTGWPS